MCMLLKDFNHKIPRITLRKPKYVYKVLRKEVKGGLCSPHRNHPYVLGERQEATITYSDTYEGTTVNGGIHAFVDPKDAFNEARRQAKECYNPYEYDYYKMKYRPYVAPGFGVFKCEIPKYELYRVGFWQWALNKRILNTVSTALIVLEEIKE